MGFKEPTPVQKACIPLGLLGRDLCACAATGTGTDQSHHTVSLTVCSLDWLADPLSAL